MANVISVKLRPEPRAAAAARRALGQLQGVSAATLDTAQLLVSELVTNSYRHGELERDDDIELTVRSQPDRLHIEVVDHGAGFDPSQARMYDPGLSPQESGWGLRIVETLSDRWGVEDNGRTLVWFDLRND